MQRITVAAPLLLSLALMIPTSGLNAQTMTVDQRSLRGCHLIGSSDPTFARTLDAHAPGAQSALSQGTLNNAVLISNDSLLTVVAYRLRWTTIEPNGRQATHDTEFSEPHVLVTHHSAGGHALAPGSTRLVSTSFNLSERELSSALPQLAQRSSSSRPQESRKVIGVKLDGVIFDDGAFSGPDESDFFTQFKASTNARHDSGVSVLLGVKQGLSDADLLKKLKEQAAKAQDNLGQSAKDYYYAQRSADADRLAMILERYGRTALIGNARKMQNEQRYNITKITN